MATANADDALPPRSTGTIHSIFRVHSVDPNKSYGTILVDNNVNDGKPVWFFHANFPKGMRVSFDLRSNKVRPENLACYNLKQLEGEDVQEPSSPVVQEPPYPRAPQPAQPPRIIGIMIDGYALLKNHGVQAIAPIERFVAEEISKRVTTITGQPVTSQVHQQAKFFLDRKSVV